LTKKPKEKKKAKQSSKRLKKKSGEEESLETLEHKRLLKVRETMKSSKPSFQRHEAWRYKKLDDSWRKPKGIDNKMRIKTKGWPKHVSVGYRSPKKVRYYHPSGKRELIIHNLNELDKVDPSKHIVKLAHTVGYRKRVQIIARAEEQKLQVANPGVEKYETEEQEENSI
jgi:large subunit ribosomal protein L32e